MYGQTHFASPTIYSVLKEQKKAKNTVHLVESSEKKLVENCVNYSNFTAIAIREQREYTATRMKKQQTPEAVHPKSEPDQAP
jgi:hypothetical protein